MLALAAVRAAQSGIVVSTLFLKGDFLNIVISFFNLYKRLVFMSFFIHSGGMASRATLFSPVASRMLQYACGGIEDACQSISGVSGLHSL